MRGDLLFLKHNCQGENLDIGCSGTILSSSLQTLFIWRGWFGHLGVRSQGCRTYAEKLSKIN